MPSLVGEVSLIGHLLLDLVQIIIIRCIRTCLCYGQIILNCVLFQYNISLRLWKPSFFFSLLNVVKCGLSGIYTVFKIGLATEYKYASVEMW